METEPNHDDRSSIAVAYSWAAKIMTISLEMVVPGLVGVWLDRWLGWVPVLTLAGFALGMTLAIWHLIKLTAPNSTPPGGRSTQSSERDPNSSDAAKPR